MACSILLVLLTLSEFRTYFEASTSSNMIIQTSHTSDKFHINIDIEMPRMPCDIIGLDVEDNMGYHIVDYYGEMHKTRMDSLGNMLDIDTIEDKSLPRDKLFEKI